MAIVYLSLGSNQGDRLLAIVRATQMIDRLIGSVLSNSYLIESEPWGFTSETPFYNIILQVDTRLEPHQILNRIFEIEKELGRLRAGKTYCNRTIDIDILFYSKEVIHSETLVIPHSCLHKRRFVLDPLVTLIPDFIHPGFNLSIKEMLDKLDDPGKISVKLQKNEFLKLVEKL